ncbi:MAG: hypothetical protein Q8881_03120, partial [Sweet potato little leaf phytoplasma]|nr:hypothetical protein [Sweet potato little leaf phytoplasma]
QLQGNLDRVKQDNADLKNQNEQLTRQLTSLQEEMGLLKERLATNFRQISPSRKFPTKRPNFVLGDASDETAESIPPNFR